MLRVWCVFLFLFSSSCFFLLLPLSASFVFFFFPGDPYVRWDGTSLEEKELYYMKQTFSKPEHGLRWCVGRVDSIEKVLAPRQGKPSSFSSLHPPTDIVAVDTGVPAEAGGERGVGLKRKRTDESEEESGEDSSGSSSSGSSDDDDDDDDETMMVPGTGTTCA